MVEMDIDEMKDPEIFRVRGPEDPSDIHYQNLKRSILEEPTVVCFQSMIIFFSSEME